MKDKSFIYYGYERATYEDCKSLISVMNRRHFGILSIWFIVVAAVYLFFSWNNMNGFNSTYMPTLFAFFAMSMAMEIFIRVFSKLADRWGKVLMHVIMLLLMGFGTVCSYIQPYMAATIFLVILVIGYFRQCVGIRRSVSEAPGLESGALIRTAVYRSMDRIKII